MYTTDRRCRAASLQLQVIRPYKLSNTGTGYRDYGDGLSLESKWDKRSGMFGVSGLGGLAVLEGRDGSAFDPIGMNLLSGLAGREAELVGLRL